MDKNFTANANRRNEKKSIGNRLLSSNRATEFVGHLIILIHNFFNSSNENDSKARHIFSQLTFLVSVERTFDFFRISHSCEAVFRSLFIYVSRIQTHKQHHEWKNLPLSLLLSRSAGVSRKTHKRVIPCSFRLFSI